MKDIYVFLGVDKNFIPNFEIKHNPTLVPKNKLLQWAYYLKNSLGLSFGLSNNIKRALEDHILVQDKTKIKPKTSDNLKAFYKEDILKLQNLIKKDLNMWLE